MRFICATLLASAPASSNVVANSLLADRLPAGARRMRTLDANEWTLRGSHRFQTAKQGEDDEIVLENVGLPSDVISELFDRGFLSRKGEKRLSPLFGRDWLDSRHVLAERDWTYELEFDASDADVVDEPGGASPILVFDGVKMGAEILWNL